MYENSFYTVIVLHIRRFNSDLHSDLNCKLMKLTFFHSSNVTSLICWSDMRCKNILIVLIKQIIYVEYFIDNFI